VKNKTANLRLALIFSCEKCGERGVKVRITLAVIINNSTRHTNHSFSRLMINQNMSLPYQCLLKRQ